MSELNRDREIADERKPFFDAEAAEEVQLEVPLRDQIPTKLLKTLEEQDAAQKLVNVWSQAVSDRAEWLQRQTDYLEKIDEFINPIHEAATDWSSNLHLPTTVTVCKTYHARMYQALLGIDPPFTMKARQAHNVERAELITELMRYTLREWVNENAGIDEAVDRWLWDWVTAGVGVLKAGWDRKFCKYADVEEYFEADIEYTVDPQTNSVVQVPVRRRKEREIMRQIKEYEGPRLERVLIEDVVIVGGEGDPQKADYVFEQCWLTSSELWQLAEQKVFYKDAVEEIIKGGEDYRGSEQTSEIKQRRIELGAAGELDKEHEIDRYSVLECYAKLDIDGSGISSRVVAWVHPRSRKILRATYLHRIMPTGLVPYFKIDFYKRHGQEYGVGIVELLYSLSQEIDAIHNIRMDIGILSSLPFGFYRPSMSSFKDERMPIEPGALIPVDNPQSDIFFPNLGNRTAFGFQEEAALNNLVERFTSISDLSLGIIGSQGATRTATGTRALLGESNANLDIFLQRMNRGWKRALKYLFHMLQQRLPDGFQFRITGDDGNNYWATVESREELAGMYDFELEANSANSNKQIQIEGANLLYQMTSNPIDLQLGLITPIERYNAVVNLLKVNGFKDFSKYVRKPDGASVKFSPVELANRILAGMPVTLDPTQDLAGFIQFVQEIIENDDLLGQFDQMQVATLVDFMQQAIGMQQALQQAQAQQAAVQQQQLAIQASSTPGNVQAGIEGR